MSRPPPSTPSPTSLPSKGKHFILKTVGDSSQNESGSRRVPPGHFIKLKIYDGGDSSEKRSDSAVTRRKKKKNTVSFTSFNHWRKSVIGYFDSWLFINLLSIKGFITSHLHALSGYLLSRKPTHMIWFINGLTF